MLTISRFLFTNHAEISRYDSRPNWLVTILSKSCVFLNGFLPHFLKEQFVHGQGFLFYTFSENRRAPGAHFAWVFGYSLEFFLKVAWVFSRLLEFPEKINYFMQILEEKCSFFARFAQFLSNFGLNIHKKCLLLLKKCWDFSKKNCHVLKISKSLGFLKK